MRSPHIYRRGGLVLLPALPTQADTQRLFGRRAAVADMRESHKPVLTPDTSFFRRLSLTMGAALAQPLRYTTPNEQEMRT